ncbi:gluconate 2-dehydrogenase subunit 3 family protein [Rubrivirga marina]|uniref:Gluconate 2-dehydrogenase subunit 3 family protein n=1 Tax=Rubrivirga marina TaxID=1196024 RepID=A0A271IW01_9BACT|nr:gluconate 2-dehydrogenase subunit 3 family protein [Rubrivirga marina]PAP75421.1 hypothetical protein BSZ37_02660 [Rubrivirga marina]
MFDSPIDRRSALRRLSYVLGGVVSAPLASGLLAGCRTPSGGELASYQYQTLAEGQQQTLAALVDQILPATDTPGASDVGVPQFIDKMLTEWYAPEERDQFLAWLDGLDAQAEGGSFTGLDDEARAAFVAALDAEAFRPSEPAAEAEELDEDVAGVATEGTAAIQEEQENEVAGMQGDLGEAMDDTTGSSQEIVTGEGTVSTGAATPPPAYRQLKELTLAGYYTSEPGATQELQWLAAPGRYDPDVPLSEVGRAWA